MTTREDWMNEQQARAVVLTATASIRDAMQAMNISPDDVKLTFAWRDATSPDGWTETVIGGPQVGVSLQDRLSKIPLPPNRSTEPVEGDDDVLLPNDGNVGDVPAEEGVDFFFGKPDESLDEHETDEDKLTVVEPALRAGESPIYDL